MESILEQKTRKFFLNHNFLIRTLLGVAGFAVAIIAIFSIFHLFNAKGADYQNLTKPTSDNGHYYNNLTTMPGRAYWAGHYNGSSLTEATWPIADPSMIKVGDTYYVYTTGSDIYAIYTTDFKTWTWSENPVLSRGSYSQLWAPEVYEYNGKYYMFTTGHNSSDNHTLVATSDSPLGPFSNVTALDSGVSNPIDPTVLFDGDHIYLYSKNDINKGEDCGLWRDSIMYVEELNSDLLSVKSGSTREVLRLDSDEYGNRSLPCWGSAKDPVNYWENDLIEAPEIIKHNNTYYLLYTTGQYTEDTYTVGYATSSSPTGPFTRVTNGNNGSASTSPLLHGQFGSATGYDSSNYIYGTGHPFIYQESEDEMYLVYHSIMYQNSSFNERKLNMDYLGFDDSGTLYINGPSTTNQPAPSGVSDTYRLASSLYTASATGSDIPSLHDYVNYHSADSATPLGKSPLVSAQATSTSTLSLALTGEAKNIEDIWLFGTDSGFNNTTATVIINDQYQVDGAYSLGSTGTAKLQLPTGIPGGVEKITLNFSNEVSLTDVTLYYNTSAITPEDDYVDPGSVVFIGDSYSIGYVPGGSPTWRGWPLLTIEGYPLDADKQCFNGEGGSGFIRAGGTGHNFSQLLDTCISGGSSMAAKGLTDQVKWVIVNAGYNDRGYSESELKTAILSFIDKATNAFPNATIALGAVGWNTVDTSAQSQMDTVAAIYQSAADSRDCAIYIPDSHLVLRNASDIMYSDYLHPNPAGQQLIADMTINFLKSHARLLGDVDEDGSVTLLDALAIARSLLAPSDENYQALSTNGRAVADFDGDGAITLLDALAIARSKVN